MKILITGVAGLIGSKFADWILETTNHKVIGIDDLSGGYIKNVHKDVGFYKFDLVEGDQLIHVNVWTPKKISKEEEEILSELKQSNNFQPKPGKTDKGFFDKIKDFMN